MHNRGSGYDVRGFLSKADRLVKTATGTRTQKEGIVEGPEIQFSEVEIDNGIHGKRHVRFETGRLAKQAAGSVLVTIDDETTLLSATAIGKSPARALTSSR